MKDIEFPPLPRKYYLVGGERKAWDESDMHDYARAAIEANGAQRVPDDDHEPMLYVASRASLPERPQMWQSLRSAGWPIISTWIDEAGEGETEDMGMLWFRIHQEIRRSVGVLLYAETGDFPLKGALIECGIALGMGKPVALVLPGVKLDGRSMKPIGSWAAHPLVTIYQTLEQAKAALLASTPAPAQQSGWTEEYGLVLEAANRVELACYDQGSAECMAAVQEILDGKDRGDGVANEPWESIRRRLIALVAPAPAQQERKPMTDEQAADDYFGRSEVAENPENRAFQGGTFECFLGGIRFAERHHGIFAEPAQGIEEQT